VTEVEEKMKAARRVRQGETVAPSFRGEAFHCVFCVVYAAQHWVNFRRVVSGSGIKETPIWLCTCGNCRGGSYWLAGPDAANSPMLWPSRPHLVPAPHPDLPDDLKADYEEAASIIDRSPRGSGALIRLVLQELMPYLGEKGKNINDDIGSLVKKGLDPGVQQALDALRVIGNNTVHPLELDLQDDIPTVSALFGLVNYIVEQRIAHPKKLQKLYDGLPQGARDAIEKRDAAPASQT
jgi:hypothetical protein